MGEVTAGELWARRDELEQTAAQVLGQMLFEFSRLDVALGLCAVWVSEGRRIEELNPRVSAMSFHERLEFIDKAVQVRFASSSKARRGYTAWIQRAHAARTKRNELVHGRWGVEPATHQVVNVLGLPTSAAQREVKYTIADLGQVLDELRSLQTELRRLRDIAPL